MPVLKPYLVHLTRDCSDGVNVIVYEEDAEAGQRRAGYKARNFANGDKGENLEWSPEDWVGETEIGFVREAESAELGLIAVPEEAE